MLSFLQAARDALASEVIKAYKTKSVEALRESDRTRASLEATVKALEGRAQEQATEIEVCRRHAQSAAK